MEIWAWNEQKGVIELPMLSLPSSWALGWEGWRKSGVGKVSWLSSSALAEALLLLWLPLLIGCGNGEASRRQDGGRLISSSRRSEVSGNERQRRGMQIAGGFMERFLLTEQIPDKWSVNKAGKFFSCASCYEEAGTLSDWCLSKVRHRGVTTYKQERTCSVTTHTYTWAAAAHTCQLTPKLLSQCIQCITLT